MPTLEEIGQAMGIPSVSAVLKHVRALEAKGRLVIEPNRARGIWALEDVVRLAPGVNLRGYGHYHETYEKTDGQWRITSSTLTRLREDIFNMFVSVYVSARLRDVIGKAARRAMR